MFYLMEVRCKEARGLYGAISSYRYQVRYHQLQSQGYRNKVTFIYKAMVMEILSILSKYFPNVYLSFW